MRCSCLWVKGESEIVGLSRRFSPDDLAQACYNITERAVTQA